MSRERACYRDPDPGESEPLEAHLSRALYRVMHELEVRQARREVDTPPLARLDLDGVAEG